MFWKIQLKQKVGLPASITKAKIFGCQGVVLLNGFIPDIFRRHSQPIQYVRIEGKEQLKLTLHLDYSGAGPLGRISL